MMSSGRGGAANVCFQDRTVSTCMGCRLTSSIQTMAQSDLPRKLMADVTAALEGAHEAAVQAQSQRLCCSTFEQRATLSIANYRKAIELAQSALRANGKSRPDS